MLDSYSDGFFNVSKDSGFLPQKDPLTKLPEKYKNLQNIIDNLPAEKPNGLLSKSGLIEDAVNKLENYIDDVKEEQDIMVLHALYRAYTFVTSAYLLSPSHFGVDNEGNYGKAHQKLPIQVAQPLVKVSDKLQVAPWLDYHYSYSLGNYVRKGEGLHWRDLDMACSFTGGKDEIGFIMNHVYINELSPKLVGGIMSCYEGEDRLEDILEVVKGMNERRRTMWEASDYRNYNKFRAFIMGIEGNEEIFGDGVIYEGVTEEPKKYRGQTGAQDDIIPTLDIFTGIYKYYPENMLTKYLMDLRQYRPKCVQNFFEDLEKENQHYLEGISEDRGKLEILYKIVGQVYYFRNGHWNFVQKYIMGNTKYAKATGGTPIISWLPNQIGAVLKYMTKLINVIEGYGGDMKKEREELGKKVMLLERQMLELEKSGYEVERIFEMNGELGLDDRYVKFD